MKKLTAIFLILIFSGCSTVKIKPAPIFEIPKGSRVGVINLVGPMMTYYDVKYDGSNNRTERRSTADIPGFINNEITRQAAVAGYEVKILEVSEDLKRALYYLTEVKEDRVEIRKWAVPVFKKLSLEHDLSIIYVIKEVEGEFKIKDRKVYPRGYGMAIELSGGIFTSFAILKAEAIYLDPVSVTRGADCSERKILTAEVISEKNAPVKKMVHGSKINENIKLIISEFISKLLENSNLRG